MTLVHFVPQVLSIKQDLRKVTKKETKKLKTAWGNENKLKNNKEKGQKDSRKLLGKTS